MEYCDEGDLAQKVEKSISKNLPFSQICKWLLDISSAVAYIHKRSIIHRDLKLENILINNGVAKLCDFGISRVVNEKNANKTMTKQVGTSIYMSPEITLGKKYSFSTDVFSLGIMMYQLLAHDLDPYSFLKKKTQYGIEQQVARSGIRPMIDESDAKYKGKKWLIQLMKRCWKETPDERPTMIEIQNIIKENKSSWEKHEKKSE